MMRTMLKSNSPIALSSILMPPSNKTAMPGRPKDNARRFSPVPRKDGYLIGAADIFSRLYQSPGLALSGRWAIALIALIALSGRRFPIGRPW